MNRRGRIWQCAKTGLPQEPECCENQADVQRKKKSKYYDYLSIIDISDQEYTGCGNQAAHIGQEPPHDRMAAGE
jgi:hypothetical protein